MTIRELREYGIVPMDDEEIRGFLSCQSVGVLALSTEGAPLLRPLSFWFDGESTLYLPYVFGSDSRKKALSDQADVARFLVYRAETKFNWRSVLLTGTIGKVSEDERDAVEDAMEISWRPDIFERATSKNVELYGLEIETQVGIKHLGLPPEFQSPP